MLHKEIWGLTLLAFLVWIFMSVDGASRIQRACRPVGWGGNVVVSLTALLLPNDQVSVKRWMDKAEYSCQYATWRLFYQSDYNRYMQANAPGVAPLVVQPIDSNRPGPAAPERSRP